MATGMQDFIQTFMQLNQMKMAKRQALVQEATSRAQQYTVAMEVARNLPDPAQQHAFVQFLGPQLGEGGTEALQELLGSVTPTAAVQREAAAARGFAAAGPEGQAALDSEAASALLTGQSAGGVASSQLTATAIGQPAAINPEWMSAATQRLVTGQTPQEYAAGQAYLGISPAQRTQASRIQQGLDISPEAQAQMGVQTRGQNINLELGRTDAALRRMDLLQRGSQWEAEFSASLQSVAQKAMATSNENDLAVIDELNQINDQIAAGNLNRPELMNLYVLRNNLLGRLVQSGNPEFENYFVDPAQAARQSFVSPMGKMFGRMPGNPASFYVPGPGGSF